jgi:nucleoside-diphosphate-sugar epimerase
VKLNPRILSGARILVTGSSGWLGSETLCYFSRLLDPLDLKNLVSLSSDGRTFEVHKRQIHSSAFSALRNVDHFDVIIHLAFLLPNNQMTVDAPRYLELNSSITRRMDTIFQKNPDALKIVLSSGAVNLDPGNTKTDPKNLYAKSKLEMESILQDDHTIILRLWSTTGHHLPLTSSYAISEFINRASLNQEILLKNNVKRSYIDFQDILDSSLKYLIDSGRGIYNSGGEITTIEKLANLVISALNSTSKVQLGHDSEGASMDYVSPECEIPKKYLTSHLSLESQVFNTVTSLVLSH